MYFYLDAPSLEGLTRHLSGGKFQPGLLSHQLFIQLVFFFCVLEKLFDIARRVPFLAMTIVEKNPADNAWLFRTQPLQTGQTVSMREVSLELARIPTPVSTAMVHPRPATPMGPPQRQQQQQQQQQHQRQHQQAVQAQVQAAAAYAQQVFPLNDTVRHRPPPGPIDPKKVVKSSTAPNLPTSNSLSEMFRVI